MYRFITISFNECVHGSSTFLVWQVAPYFAKIECFCFEEQKLLAGEEVDMPLFFFIDKDFLDDPSMADVQDIVLSYTFFKYFSPLSFYLFLLVFLL